MKKKMLASLIICFLVSIFVSTQVSAYIYSRPFPTTKTLYYGWHETLPTAGRVSPSWSSSDGFAAYYNFKVYSGAIDATDLKNSVGGMVTSIPGVGSSFIAANMRNGTSTYSTFDVVLNAAYTFGNGSAQTYKDYQGVLTHEFGHLFGLGDLYTLDFVLAGKTKSNVPTMFYGDTFDGTSNIYYYLRSPESDDITGKAEVAKLIN